MISDKAEEIARLNDEFRADLDAGILILSEGIQQTPLEDVEKIIDKVQKDNNFEQGNNPYGERDFGAVKHNNKNIFWKIDYFDNELRGLSPDASDPTQTIRALTIMYAEEY